MITQEENLKINLYKKFKAFYDGNAYEFPNWEFIYRATKLSEKTKSDFATLIYHVLNDLFSETSISWFEYISIDRENKLTTGFHYTSYSNKVNIEKTEIVTDYKNKPEHEWNWIKDKTIEVLNQNPLTYPSYKYQKYLNIPLESYVEIWATISSVKEHYREFFLPNIHLTSPSTNFENYIKDGSPDYEEMSNYNKLKEISSNHDLDFYYSKQFCKSKFHEIFLEEIDDYFTKGEGKITFNLLTFLNLFDKQLATFTEYNRIGKPYAAVEHLKNLYQLNSRERHTLYGMILKFYETYPLYSSKYLASSFTIIALSLVQREFLKYPENTPEKIFCLNRGIRKKEIPLITFPNSSYYKYTEDSFKDLAEANDWDFYYSLEVNQKVLIVRTIEHFEIGLRKGLVEPKAILNLIYKYYALFKEQEDKAITNLNLIEELPIEEELKHIILIAR